MTDRTEPPVSSSETPELSQGLLSFYDRLRIRIVGYVDRRGGRLGARVAEVLLLGPDVFILMARLALDREVPAGSRSLIAGGLAYFVLPADLLPEGVIGPSGYLEDVVLGLLLIERAFSADLAPWAERYWSGPVGLNSVLGDVSHAGHALLGENLWKRLKRMLSQRGVEVA